MTNILKQELEKRELPDLFVLPNGERIHNKDGWEKIMRPYWKDVLLNEEYGKQPELIEPQITVKEQPIDFAGKITWEEIDFRFAKNGKAHTVPTQLLLPSGKRRVPVFVVLNFRADVPDRYLPVEEIIDNGFGIFTVCYNDITKDNGDFTDGLAALFQDGERGPCATGKIGYWAYMASRMMDYLQTRPEINKKEIGVAGHSRLGKTALLCAALDERFAFVCANNSGCSGAALARGRGKGGESIRDICVKFPYWFCPKYLEYADKEKGLPFDQHCLIALIAPRRVYIGGAIQDVWADNDNQFLSCVAASEAWGVYDRKGVIAKDRLPVVGDIFIDGEVGFYLREGKHFFSRSDWLVYLAAVKKTVNKSFVKAEK